MTDENLPAKQDSERYLARVGKAALEMRKISGMETVPLSDLTQLRVPGAGSTTWEIPGSEPQKTLTGYVLDVSMIRKSFYATAYEDSSGSDLPDCASDDNHTGVPREGFDYEAHGITLRCRTCPMNQFKSSKSGRGKACSDYRWMVVLLEGDLLPVVIKVPGSSLRSLKDGLQAATRTGQRIMNITLEKVDSTPPHSRIRMMPVREASEAEERAFEHLKAVFTADQEMAESAQDDEVPF